LKFKMRANVGWTIGPVDTMLRVTHLNGYTNTVVTPNQLVAGYTPVDLNIGIRVGNDNKPFVLGIEVRNLFDVKPPYVNIAPSVNGSGGYDATASDPIGRLIAFSVRKTF